MPTLSNGTVVPPDDGDVQISATGVAEMRALGASVDAQLGNRYTKAQADALLAEKAASSHTHALEDVTGLAARLAALEYDSGWLDVSADLRLGATGVLHIRRVGLRVYWRLRDFVAGTAHAFYWPPAGLNAPSVPNSYPPQTPDNTHPIFLDSAGRFTRPINAPVLAAGRWWEGAYLLPTGTPPMVDPPGEAVPA